MNSCPNLWCGRSEADGPDGAEPKEPEGISGINSSGPNGVTVRHDKVCHVLPRE